MFKLLHTGDPLQGLDYCLAELACFAQQDYSKRAFLLVPEEAKADTERRYMEKFDRRGLMLAEVLSFKRLAYRIFSELGGLAVKHMGNNGKALLLTRILQEKKADYPFLGRLAGKAEYAAELSRVLGDFQRYQLPSSALRELAEEAPSRLSREKFIDLAQLQDDFFAAKKALGVYDGDEDLDRLARLLQQEQGHPRLAFLKDAKIWVAGFALLRAFTPQEIRLLQVLASQVAELTLVLSLDDPSAPEQSIATSFASESYRRLQAHGAKPCTGLQASRLPGEEREIYLWRSSDSLEEVRAAAGEIKLLLKSGQYRRRDIAVGLCRPEDVDRVAAVFKEYSLDPFIAEAAELNESPLLKYLEYFFRLATPQGKPADLISLAQSGLLELDFTQLDLYENYLLASPPCYLRELTKSTSYQRHGGPAAWSFYQKHLALHLEAAFELKSLPTAAAKARALMSFLDETAGLRQKLEQLALDLNAKGEAERALLLANSWEILLQILEETEELLGDSRISMGEFSELILAALASQRPQGIPLGLDRIRVAAPQQLLLYPAKVLFLLGATQKTFPPPAPAEGLLQNREREFIEAETNFRLPNYRRDALRAGRALEHYLLYRGKDKLYISSPQPALEEVSLLHAELLASKDYPEQVFSHKDYPDQRWLSTSAATRNLAASPAYGRWRESWQKLLAGYMPSLPRDLLDEPRPLIYLPHVQTQAYLDSLDKLSISRLQSYNACPYRYFADYLLKARERKLYRPQPTEQGSFLHALYEEAYTQLIAQLQEAPENEVKAVLENWQANLTPQFMKGLYNKVSKEAFPVYQDALIQGQSGTRLLRSVAAGLKEDSQERLTGDYLPYAVEYVFPQQTQAGPFLELQAGGKSIFLQGVIDRIDRSAESRVRLIDYKSSKQDLDAQKLLFGEQLQLPLYACAWALEHPQDTLDYLSIEQMRMPEHQLVEKATDLDKSADTMRRKPKKAEDVNLELLSAYSYDLAQKILQKLSSGEISPHPLALNERDARCQYCSYKSLCRYDERSIRQRQRLVNLQVRNDSKNKELNHYLEIYQQSKKLSWDLKAAEEAASPKGEPENSQSGKD